MGQRKLTAAVLIGLAGPVDDETARQRFAERDTREARDTRTPAQRWFGDPPAGRSALADYRRRQVGKVTQSK